MKSKQCNLGPARERYLGGKFLQEIFRVADQTPFLGIGNDAYTITPDCASEEESEGVKSAVMVS